jgi:hypothetical protein
MSAFVNLFVLCSLLRHRQKQQDRPVSLLAHVRMDSGRNVSVQNGVVLA